MKLSRLIRPALLVVMVLLVILARAVPPLPAIAGLIQNQHPRGRDGSGLIYYTLLAGGGTDNAWDIAVDGAGNTYITGITDSADFPTTPGAFDTTYNGNSDAFVVKLSPTGDIVYSTFLGGTALDQGSKIAVDQAGNAYIAGYTFSTDFPTTPGAYDPSFNGGDIDAFVAKLDPTGSTLIYSTFLGGNADDYGGGITVDGAGSAYVTGYTESADFPTTTGAFDTTYNGGGDAIAVKINPAGSDLDYATFVGGSAFESGYDIALDGAGNAYLTGQTQSGDFPSTPGAYDPTYNGGIADAFVIKVVPDGSDLAYATFLGGGLFDDAKGIAVDAAGDAYVAGRTDSGDFPTTPGAYDPTYNGGRDVFVVNLDPAGSALVYATFLGGSDEDEAGGIALDGAGNAYVTGWTISSDFPITPGAYDPSYNGDYDAFITELLPAGNDLAYSTFFGTASPDYGRGIGVDGAGSAYVAGYTGSPSPDAFGLELVPGNPPGPTPTATASPTSTPTATATSTATPMPPSHELYLPVIQRDWP